MFWGTRLCGLLAALALAGATGISSAKAAVIHYNFVGTMDTAIVDFDGVNAPAGTAFSGSFSYDENAPEAGRGSALPLQRQFTGESFKLAIGDVAEPLFDSDDGVGTYSVIISTTPYGMVGISFTRSGEVDRPAHGGFLNIFPSLTPQVVNPLLLLPDADDLHAFALAAIAFGPFDGSEANPDDFQGTVGAIASGLAAVPLPPAAWLFLTAMAGLAIIRVRRV